MPQTHPSYAPEFRRQMIELVRAGRDPADLARELKPSARTIRNWIARADRQGGRKVIDVGLAGPSTVHQTGAIPHQGEPSLTTCPK